MKNSQIIIYQTENRETKFCKWATKQLREYIVKGFVLDDERF
ncbi:hypothetical protein ES708_14520 [subsurface metagenome]